MFLTRRFYIVLTAAILCVGLGYVFPVMFVAGKIIVWLLVLVVVTEVVMLYCKPRGIDAVRLCSQRFSNGDDNEVNIRLTSRYTFGSTWRW